MQYWVFDLDNTLVDSAPDFFKVVEGIFKGFGQTFATHHHHESLSVKMIDFFIKYLGPVDGHTALAQLRSHSAENSKHIKLFDGVTDILEKLSKSNRPIAIWTARDLESSKLILESTGLDKWIKICISSSCVKTTKPHPEGLEMIAEHFGSTADSFVVIGDHEHDVLGAKTFGATAVRASWHQMWEHGECSMSDKQFFSMSEFSAWVDDQVYSTPNATT